jgi:hypothetical protein
MISQLITNNNHILFHFNMADSPATKRRKLAVNCILAIGSSVILGFFSSSIVLPAPIREQSSSEDMIRHEAQRRSEFMSLVMADSYAAEPRYKCEQIFWDIYDGDDDDFYKEYRMKKSTFDTIVEDCIPFLYDTIAVNEEAIRARAVRSKVTIAVLIRYLASQMSQHDLGKQFGVRQPCISKRIRRGYKALLSAYYWTDCPKPKISFPTNQAERDEVSTWFFNRSSGIPYILGAIDGAIIYIYIYIYITIVYVCIFVYICIHTGTIINCSAPFETRYIPREFWNSRKHSYAFNAMFICDHKKKFIYVDSRWPGSTNDTGAVARSSFLSR